MTPDEAHDRAMETVRKLEELDGIDVFVSQCPLRADQEVRERYNLPDRAYPDKWVTVSFVGEDLSKVVEAKEKLFEAGMSFDSWYGFGAMDWELDWSFSFQPKKEGAAA